MERKSLLEKHFQVIKLIINKIVHSQAVLIIYANYRIWEQKDQWFIDKLTKINDSLSLR